MGTVHAPPDRSIHPRKLPPQTPVRFPQCSPQAAPSPTSPPGQPLVPLLQSICRPADFRDSHFEALGLHVISDAPSQDIVPDSSFLPPAEEWNAIDDDILLEVDDATKKPLNNGKLCPGAQTYRERQSELFIDNTAAFRTIRRIPPPTGEAAVRLGNAYEFFKNLELFSAYWDDTSLPTTPEPPSKPDTPQEQVETPHQPHLQTHQRTGIGSQLPPEFRQNLLTAFIKLVAYDFGCNVSFPRHEPRLYLTPPPSSSAPPSHFNSSANFIYRIPTERIAARSGTLEGPVAAISCRTSTVFATEADSRLDLAREVVAVLLTAQQRAREGKTEKRFGQDKWWATKPRWGGGPGGPIGREADKPDELASVSTDTPESTACDDNGSQVVAETRRLFGISGPSSSKRAKKARGNMHIYENYRKLMPPAPMWDRRARYCPIGKEVSVGNDGFDDIFLVSSLNHHVSIVRVRVPDKLLSVLGGEDEGQGWGRLVMWRSKWYDLFLAEERVEAMQLVWGMIAYLMREIDVLPACDKNQEAEHEDQIAGPSKTEK
ncbi:Uncharacterized protein BP5553_08964 [Venustampulla echinocandica]|uniref:Uncharacterized protein n=1 Tax=Venustampulla echinocandica TaxID=2656787 RepID=A0A370TDF7_9HELO|nr:Uncharacterized protein BP5553_08964 [Venustampulla echinocandica]RDL32508.1 Uncharacterized protein BP5553_08964 [Venustampulla echinocandica]